LSYFFNRFQRTLKMEIKITCGCGTKFKFDVTPVNGRMPFPVACPSCGADGTEQANKILQESQGSAPIATAVPIPVAQPLAASAPAPATVAPSSSAAGGLKINRSHPADAAAMAPAPIAYVPPAFGAGQAAAAESRTNGASGNVKKIVALVLVGAALLGAGYKWFGRIRSVVRMAAAVGSAATGSRSEGGPENLWYDNCSILFVKHTNQLEVAEACKSFWKDKWQQTLTVSETETDMEEKGEYQLIPAHNGWIRILTAFEWPPDRLEAVAQHLSEKLNTQAFEWRSESFADTYHFGVYEKGARKFHAKMDVKIANDDAQEIVTAEGKDWVIAQGYKPENDFAEFSVLDADQITRKLGMKLSDEKEGTEMKGLLMKEVAGK
jgi:hypothetical protein